MTKQHQAIAAILAEQYRFANNHDAAQAHRAREIIWALCNYFATDNPKFDRAQFLKACEAGVEYIDEGSKQ